MKIAFLLIGTLLMGTLLKPHTALAQPAAVRFEQLDSLQKAAPRPVVVFIYTNWCSHCATMKQTTLKNKEVQQLLKEQFYFVLLNAESPSAISWNGYTFQFKPTGKNTGVHELAVQLGTIDGELSYPVLTFLSDRFEIIHQLKGYVPANDFKKILITVKNAY